MLTVFSYSSFPSTVQGSVLAIGNFDGVHKGHQRLISVAREQARRLGVPLVALTFEPHPREFFQPQVEPFRLTLLSTKQRLLTEAGVDILVAQPFTADFAALSAADFVEKILVQVLRVCHVVVGADFNFGHRRQGSTSFLMEAAARTGFEVTLFPVVTCPQGLTYSSTQIRDALRQGDLRSAAEWMGRPFVWESEVVEGDKRGRTIGYPTANQRATRYVRLPYGIYATWVALEEEEKWRPAVSSYGIRPMFEVKEPLLETYILDFDQDIYGQRLQVQPERFLRPEGKFSGLDVLKAQIAQDCITARACLKSLPSS